MNDRVQSAARWRLRHSVVLGVVALLAVLLTSPLVGQAPAVQAQAQGTSPQTFRDCGVVTHFTVPAGVTEITMTAQGGSGNSGSGPIHDAGRAGLAAVVTATIPVTPEAPLSITPGCSGANGGRGYTTGADGGGASGISGGDGGHGGGSSGVVAWNQPVVLVAPTSCLSTTCHSGHRPWRS